MTTTTTKESRHWRRYAISLSATVQSRYAQPGEILKLRGTIISLSAGGCAIRTTVRLAFEEPILVSVAFGLIGSRQPLVMPAVAIWGRDDFRIDTFYVQGLRFLEPLAQAELTDILREEAIMQVLTGSMPSHSPNKVVA